MTYTRINPLPRFHPSVKTGRLSTSFNVETGDIVQVVLKKDRKQVKAGIYTARVKTPTKEGCEVKINGFRVPFSSMKDVHFIHQSDGYSYE